MRLADDVAIVTGSSSGIGRETIIMVSIVTIIPCRLLIILVSFFQLL
ncbi:MAG: hypothetical protein MUO76_09980 [Anaerolineaceae bacterium]|nr:hypothetical protein [Anaerolineaceae bacterium]